MTPGWRCHAGSFRRASQCGVSRRSPERYFLPLSLLALAAVALTWRAASLRLPESGVREAG
jgi:hypothetical protein